MRERKLSPAEERRAGNATARLARQASSRFDNSFAQRWIVMCRVSGGVTGTRQAPLKAAGEIKYFETKEAAQAEASRLLEQTQGNPYRTADFQYWPEEAF